MSNQGRPTRVANPTIFRDKRIFIRDTFSELDAGSCLFVTHILRGVERGCDAWVRVGVASNNLALNESLRLRSKLGC